MSLAALRTLPSVRQDLDRFEIRMIANARDAGATWREIAEALGLRSPQAAAQRYQRLAGRLRIHSA